MVGRGGCVCGCVVVPPGKGGPCLTGAVVGGGPKFVVVVVGGGGPIPGRGGPPPIVVGPGTVGGGVPLGVFPVDDGIAPGIPDTNAPGMPVGGGRAVAKPVGGPPVGPVFVFVFVDGNNGGGTDFVGTVVTGVCVVGGGGCVDDNCGCCCCCCCCWPGIVLVGGIPPRGGSPIGIVVVVVVGGCVTGG